MVFTRYSSHCGNRFLKVFAEMEARQSDPILSEPGSQRARDFDKTIEAVRKTLKEAMSHRDKVRDKSEEILLIDRIHNLHSDQQTRNDDCLCFLVASFHTTGNLLTWALYYLASHPDVQNKVKDELNECLEDGEDVSPMKIHKLRYLRQVINESMRCGVIGPWAARVMKDDCLLGGFNVPKNSPVIHALGVAMQDPGIWPEPAKFDPDRFAASNHGRQPQLAFSPFGFAGKRICPGQNLAYLEATIFLASVIRRFKVTLVEGQHVKHKYGFVTHPAEEVWVTLGNRR